MAEQERQKTAARKKANRKRMKTVRRQYQIFGIALLIVLVFIIIGILAARGVFYHKADATTLTIAEDGTITFEEIVTLDENYYDASEMKSYVKEQIKDFNKESKSGTIKLKRFESHGSEVYLRTEYSTAAAYRDFTKYDFSIGKISDLQKDGVAFDDTFVAVESGLKGSLTPTETVTENTKLNAVSIEENVTVIVPGTIAYVSDSNTTLNGENSVTIAQEDAASDAVVTTYIIYE